MPVGKDSECPSRGPWLPPSRSRGVFYGEGSSGRDGRQGELLGKEEGRPLRRGGGLIRAQGKRQGGRT